MRTTLIALMVLMCASITNAGSTWLTAGGGYSTYGLDELTDGTTSYRGYTPEPGTLDSGISLTAAFGIEFSERWSVGVCYERCNASTSSVSGGSKLQANLPLNAYLLEAGWYPLDFGRMRIGLGAGVGMGSMSGSLEALNGTDPSHGHGASASGVLVVGRIMAEHPAFRNLSFWASAGARRIQIDKLEVGSVPLRRDDNDEIVQFDYSGLFFRLGLKWLLPAGESGI